MYVRFQGTSRNRRGTFPGVFGLVNGLAFEGKLTEEQERFRRVNNDWYHANFTNPSDVDPRFPVRSSAPGRVIYEDEHQIVVVPAGPKPANPGHG